jgi:phosphatidylglycerol:prolipoprotein diacylglycerol transferase
MTLGVLLGGRLGYVLFYEPRFFLSRPWEIPAIWNGGMAFHGALIGSITAIGCLPSASAPIPWSVLDACAAATPMGCFSGVSPTSSTGSCGAGPVQWPGHWCFRAVDRLPPSEPALRGLSRGSRFVRRVVVADLPQTGVAMAGLIGGAFLTGYGWRAPSASSSANRTLGTG